MNSEQWQGYPNRLWNIRLTLLALALASCIGCEWIDSKKQSETPVPVSSSAAKSTILPVGSPECPYGGINIESGLDADNNAVLDASEVSNSSPVCNGAAESIDEPNTYRSLVKIESEPTGTWCAVGGLKVLAGSDMNKNGLLDPDDIAYTAYLCSAGTNSAAGIVLAAGPPAADDKKKKKPVKASPAKKDQAAKIRSSSPASAPPSERTEAEEKAPLSAAREDKPAAAAKPERKAAKVKPSDPTNAGYKPVQGWTEVQVKSPNLAKVAYKLDGKTIIVRFRNISESQLRFIYTVRWKGGQNGKWVDDSTMEGIGFRLRPQEQLDREVRTQANEVKDIVVDLDVTEAN